MIATKIAHSGKHAISAPSLSLVLLLLLSPLKGSCNDGVLSLKEESGLMMDGIPTKHRDNLKLLTTVLALDKQWSAVWSEKLTPDVFEDAGLVKEFCSSLILPKNNENINTIDLVKLIMIHCSHSGMYVKFAVGIVALSVQCLFIRYAELQLDIIKNITVDDVKPYALHLESMENDYHLIANMLFTINGELDLLITLAKFFGEVRRQWIDENINSKYYKKKIERMAEELREHLNWKKMYCAEEPKQWYSQDKKDAVTLSMEIIENFPKPDDSSTSNPPEYAIPENSIVRKAHELRLIFRKEFEKLLLGKLPLKVWKLIFENNILVRPMESKKKKTNIFPKLFPKKKFWS